MNDPALLICQCPSAYASTVPGSTLTPGPIVDDTATRWT